MTPIKVVLADDHPVVLLGLSELIGRDRRFLVVGKATSSTGLVCLLREQTPNIVITDYHMPEESIYGDGLKLVNYLARNFPVLGIVVLTMISSTVIRSRLHKLGATVVGKNQGVLSIQNALDKLAEKILFYGGERPFDLKKESAQGVDHRLELLNVRELEILRLFMFGMGFRAIALDQNISVKTVSAYKMATMKKLGVKSDPELISYCVRTRMFN